MFKDSPKRGWSLHINKPHCKGDVIVGKVISGMCKFELVHNFQISILVHFHFSSSFSVEISSKACSQGSSINHLLLECYDVIGTTLARIQRPVNWCNVK